MKRERTKAPLCACGCGEPVRKNNSRKWNKYLVGHRTKIARMKSENHPSWTGGRVVSSNGYAYVKNWDHPHCDKQGYVKEDRIVMEKHLGRHLETEEVVHHKNGNKLDNRLENLQLFQSNSEHIKHHAKHITESTRNRLSEANKGRKFPPEFGEAISKRMSGTGNHRFGKKASMETRRKMSEAQKKRPPCSEETKRKISQAKMGYKFSDEAKKKMSESAKNRWKQRPPELTRIGL